MASRYTVCTFSNDGTTNMVSISMFSVMDRSPRAPDPRRKAIFATSASAHSVAWKRMPFIANWKLYCFMSEFFWLRQYIHETLLVQTLSGNNDGKPTDELRDHAELDKILGDGVVKVLSLDFEVFNVFLHGGAKADGGGVHSFVDDCFETCKGAAADEENVGGVDLDEISTRILTPRFLGNIDHVALHNLEQRVLHALPRHIATDADVPPALTNLIRLVDVDDASLTAFQVLSALEVQLEQNAFDIFTDVPRLRQTRRVGNHQRDIHQLGQRLDQQSLATSSGSDNNNIALVQFAVLYLGSNFVIWIGDGPVAFVIVIAIGSIAFGDIGSFTKRPGQSARISSRRVSIFTLLLLRRRRRRRHNRRTPTKLCQPQIRHSRLPKTRRILIIPIIPIIPSSSSQMPLPPRQLSRLLSLYIPQMRSLHRRLLRLPHDQSLVVIVHSHRKGDFDIALSDDVFVESVEDGTGGGEGLGRRRSVVIGRLWWWWRNGIVDGVAAGCTMAGNSFLIIHYEVGWTAWYFFVVAVYVLGRVGLIGNMLHHKLRMRNLTTRRPRRQSLLMFTPITTLCPSSSRSSNI
mmetsp:Transcript_1574/g.2910  ORF Transcript_1574/g.2910 Transcript_1574/m.2910 type:complete len:575 (-) Transcript_1574:427-2151(-)